MNSSILAEVRSVPKVPREVGTAAFAAAIADIARTLESPLDAQGRVRRVLDVVRDLVACDSCALATRNGEAVNTCVVAPAYDAPARTVLAASTRQILEVMDGETPASTFTAAPTHLAVPVIGQDRIVGVLLVDRQQRMPYEPHHVRLLSAIASQLGAYLTMVALHDETARQATLLADREGQLREATRFREEFIGVIGHDLRNPLSAIQTAMQLLLKRANLGPQDAAVAQRAHASADRMARMIDELLDFTRGRLGGGIPLRRTVVNLHALCKDVVDEAETARGRRISLNVSGEPKGHWDASRLGQLLSNLVANAVDHSPVDSPVSVTARDDGDRAVVEVSNAGTPIPADLLADLFNPFRRGDTTTSAGLGLGLYIAERIVHAHGGTIGVTSSAAEGTTFTVTLPRRRASDRNENRPRGARTLE